MPDYGPGGFLTDKVEVSHAFHLSSIVRRGSVIFCKDWPSRRRPSAEQIGMRDPSRSSAAADGTRVTRPLSSR